MSRAGSSSRSFAGFCLTLAALVATVFAGPASAQEGDGLIPEGDWTQEQVDFMLDLIAEAETVLPTTFPEVATKAELQATLGPMGFHDFGIEAPGGYAHWINLGWMDGETLDPAEAESLVYQRQEDGTYRLVSAMYMLGIIATMDQVPEEIAWLPGWHTHGDLCINYPEFTWAGFPDGRGECASGEPGDRPPMAHVWIVDNACNHRFGGVDQGGLHCEVHGPHEPGPHEPGPHEPGPHEPGPHAPGPHEPGPHEPGDDHGPGGDHEPGDDDHRDVTSPPARPVVGEPSFTG